MMVLIIMMMMIVYTIVMIMTIRFTIVLAAFDLEEFGSQGALVFIHDFLIPKVQLSWLSSELICGKIFV